MKKIITLFSIVLCLISATKAQDNFKDKSPEERAKKQTEWMQQELALDSTVVPAVHAINLKYADKITGLKNSSEDRYSKLQEFKALSASKDKELKAIFTAGQYDLYLKKKGELKDYLKQNIRENRRNK